MDQTRHVKADELRTQIQICETSLSECVQQELTGKTYALVSIPVALRDQVKTLLETGGAGNGYYPLPLVKSLLETAKKGYESEYAAL